MDRRRAAGALLALAACIASSAAAPTASNQTALDLYDETTEGCYYNFQHYGEGDRIMTNEPCLNCTCHNRMLMCYLRVCPFTKAIGQDCTVEKRADQCCPIVTCPDVPVDLLTSTSTSSPAEFGGTGLGKVDKYGCTINDKYFSEGAKVPPSPGKPCEHCYCIRNMTTCVMQECTLHVDGCTPIYHKDVCCPVRYYCDHPEDEMPLLDDMTTTVRPTPGFLLTTVALTEPPPTTLPARRDCIEDDQLYSDGALIKTDKPCEHCYCMKGDIVCVVQECGTPMENEGKNCTSLPPREGQCCPDTYICEGDELNTEVPTTETLSEEPVTTIVPPRRASVEGSGYRNEPDEMSYTEVPTFATEMEGSGEDELTVQPEKDLVDKYGTTEEAEFIPLTTQFPISEKTEIVTTEPDKGLNTVPSGIVEEESTESALQEKTTSEIPLADYEHTRQEELSTTPLASESEKSSEPSLEITTPIHEAKATEPSIVEETTEKESVSPLEKETTLGENKQTESSVSREPETYTTIKPEDNILSTKEPTITETATSTDLHTESVPGGDEIRETSDASVAPTILSDEIKTTASPMVKEKDDILPSDNETTVSPITEKQEGEVLPPNERKTTVSPSSEEGEMLPSVDETKATVLPLVEENETFALDSRRTTFDLGIGITPKYEDKTEALVSEYTTSVDKLDTTEAAIIEQNTVSSGAEAGQSTELPSKMTSHEESKITDLTSTTEGENIPTKPLEKEIGEPSFEITTTTSRSIIDSSEILSTTVISQEKVPDITTEPIFKNDEEITTTESDMNKELSTIGTVEVAKETEEPSKKEISTEKATINEQETEVKITTLMVPEKQEEQEATTEFIMELSTLAHVTEKDLASTLHPENLATTTATVPDKINMPQSTTINPAENEISEIPSPGKIPGEGDCLLEGKTYQNNSVVPSINKCHSGCKCVSSIIKCDPIICSPPPENMDNCQPRYDTPEACCPTYVCDQRMQTILPQSQSHITGTERPTTSTIECHGKDCDRHDEIPSDKPSQIPGHIDNECGSSSCNQTIQSPAQPCTEDQCGVLKPPIEQEKPQEIPSIDTLQSCTNPEDCKEIKIPVTCEGQSCADSQGSPCDKEGGCLIKPEEMPVHETPQVCTTEEECKQIKIPQPESIPCEGESCVNVQEDCSTGECKIIDILPQPSQQGEECSKENGCTKPDQAVECADANCVQKEVDTTEIVCSGDICMQQQPTSSTEATAHTGSIATVLPPSEQVTSRQPILEEKTEPSSPKLPTTLPEEEITDEATVTSEPNKETKEPEPPVSDEEDEVTKSPNEIVSSLIPESTDVEQALTESSNEPATEIPQEHSTLAIKIDETAIPVSSPTEESSQHELEVKPTTETAKRPEDMTESHDVSTEKPEEFIEKETAVPKEQYNHTKHTDQPVSPPLDESTKESEMIDREQEPITVSPESSVTEAVNETIKPQEEPEKSSTESQTPEMVTASLSEVTTKLSETSESGITVTETSVQESHEYPEMSTSSGEIVTKTELSTKSPASMAAESTMSTYEKELISTIQVTEQQEDITKVPKEDTEKRTTIPEYSKDEDKTTTLVSDTTEAIVLADTKLPESDEKYTTTEIPIKPTEFDEYVPTEHISIEEIPDKHLISTETPEQSEIVTPVPNMDTDQTDIVDIDLKEKVTSMPETTIFDKETESPLTHVTELSHPDSTSIITESNEMPKSSSTAPSQEKEYDTTKTTLAPKSDVMDEAASLSGAEKTEAPQIETTEENLPVESATEQEVITEMPLSAVTEPAKPFIIEQQPSLQPPTSDSEVLFSQEPVTKATVEEVPEVLEKTTSLPPKPATIGEKVEEVTEPREPTIFEEHDISTDAPESPEKEVHDSATTNLDQEILTKEPELYVTVATHIDKPTESLEKEQITEKPTLEVKKEQTVAPDTTEIVPVIVTESQDLPEQVPEKVSTQIPVSDEEKTENPEESKQTFTESPKTTTETEIIHHEPTIIPQLVDSEPQKLSTEKSTDSDLSTIIPELEATVQHDIEKESMPVTSGPETPMEEAQTKLPEIQQTTSNAQPESASPEITKTTTISPKIEEIEHENKQTEQPVPLVTEEVLYTTAKPNDDTTAGQEQDIDNKKEEKPAESTSEKISETTELPVKISTMIPVSEEDKQPEEPVPTSSPEIEPSETTPYLVELEEHTHKIDDEESTIIPSDEPTVASSEEPGHTSSSSISTSEDSTNAPSLGTTIISSEEPAFAPSEKPTGIPSEQSTVAPTEELTLVPSKEPTVVQSEESTVATIAEATVSLLGEPTVSDSEEQSVASSEKPNVALSEEPSTAISEEPTTTKSEMHTTEQQVIETVTEKLASEENQTELPVDETERPSDHKELVPLDIEEHHTTVTLEETPEKSTESMVAVETTVKPTDELLDKNGIPEDSEKEAAPTTLKPVFDDTVTMNIPFSETEIPASVGETEKVVTAKPQFVPAETTAPEEEFIPVTTKVTTSKPEDEAPTEISHNKPEDKPSEPASSAIPEISKPDEMQPIDEVPLPEDESHFPPSGGYNQEPDYVEEDQAFGPGTCRYGGKVYVSAQQIPRDDPCDFCFCFRSDIICLQQSCPPPIHGCHEEPIQGFCCPRYECPVSMATTLNVTTTTTTTTTTLPPHFLPHAYKGAATRKGCQIKGHTYQVGEVVRASSGPCLHCTCGGDGQMKCDPKQCTPEPMLRQMIAAAVSAKRRR